MLVAHVPGFVPGPAAELNATEKKRNHKKRKQRPSDKFSSVNLAKQRANAHWIPVKRQKFDLEGYDSFIGNTFYLFGWAFTSSRISRFLKSGRIGSSGRIRTYDQSVNSRPLYH